MAIIGGKPEDRRIAAHLIVKGTDPFGHVWALATPLERLTPEEVDRRAMEHFGLMREPAS